MGLCGIPLYVTCNAIRYENICIAQAVVFRFTAVSTMFHILAITGERYICVLHPMQYITIVTGKRILRVIACIWAISLFVALIQLSWVLPFGYFSKNAIKFSSSLIYNCVGLTVCFAIPFFSMVVVCSKMFITIRRQVRKIKRQSLRLDAATSSINIRSSYRQLRALLGVANGLSKMLSLGKFTPSLGISALKNSVSESRISGKMTVSESRILKIWISKSRILKIWISKSRQWEFNFFFPQAYPKREIKKFTPAGICIYNCYVKYI